MLQMKQRLALQMDHPWDRVDISEEIELFSLSRIPSACDLSRIANDAAPDEITDTVKEVYGSKDGQAVPGTQGCVSGASPSRGIETARSGADELDYISRLDDELESLYMEYKVRACHRKMIKMTMVLSSKPSYLPSTHRPRPLPHTQLSTIRPPEKSEKRGMGIWFIGGMVYLGPGWTAY